MLGDGGAGFCHLHQRDDALLHTRAAAQYEADDGKGVFGGVFKRLCDLFPHRVAHAAHREAVLHRKQRALYAADLCGAADDAVFFARLFAQGGELFVVAGEGKRVAARLFGEQFFKVFRTEGDTIPRGEFFIMPAFGADAEVLLHLVGKDDPAALFALFGEFVGDRRLLLRGCGSGGRGLFGAFQRIFRLSDKQLFQIFKFQFLTSDMHAAPAWPSKISAAPRMRRGARCYL